MVYDRAMLEIFPRQDLRRFVTWIWNIRMRLPSIVLSPTLKWMRTMPVDGTPLVLGDGTSHLLEQKKLSPRVLIIADLIFAFGLFDALLVFLIPMGHAIRDSLVAGVHAPSVTSFVEREEEEQESDRDEQDPPAPDSSPASTPSTSVGGSLPVAASPRRAPGAQLPPQRRRSLEPVSPLFPATAESVSEVQPPSAQANGNSAGANADSSADASHSTSLQGRCLHLQGAVLTWCDGYGA
ncbi:hypothetical protein Emag_006924 [Eimeria magna]